jgi:hypothetical protein
MPEPILHTLSELFESKISGTIIDSAFRTTINKTIDTVTFSVRIDCPIALNVCGVFDNIPSTIIQIKLGLPTKEVQTIMDQDLLVRGHVVAISSLKITTINDELFYINDPYNPKAVKAIQYLQTPHKIK